MSGKTFVLVTVTCVVVSVAGLLVLRNTRSKAKPPMAAVRHVPPDLRSHATHEAFYVSNVTDDWVFVQTPTIEVQNGPQGWNSMGAVTNWMPFALAPHTEVSNCVPSRFVEKPWRLRIRVSAETQGVRGYWGRAKMWWYLRRLRQTGRVGFVSSSSFLDYVRNAKVYAAPSEELVSGPVGD